jgi:uncharacterized protein involved in tellurium resistance
MSRADLEAQVTHVLQTNPQWYQHDGVLPINASSDDKVSMQLIEHVEKIRICPVGAQQKHLVRFAVPATFPSLLIPNFTTLYA